MKKPYEPVVHMFTIFFYVLMSLALKEILTSHDFHEPEQKWPCFIAAVFLFTRFMFGSSSHLYAEHADERKKEDAVKFFTVHLIWIMVFALVGTAMCFAHTVHAFLFWNVVFGGIALIASFTDRLSEECSFPKTWASGWLLYNGIHTVVSIGCLIWHDTPTKGGEVWGWNLPLLVLASVLAGLLFCDFRRQLRKLREAYDDDPTNKTDIRNAQADKGKSGGGTP